MLFAKVFRQALLIETLLLFTSLTPAVAATTPLDAIILANDVLVYANENIGDPSEIEGRIDALGNANGFSREKLQDHVKLKIILTDLMQSAAHREDIPWKTPRNFSEITRTIISNSEHEKADIHLVLEFISLQYLAKTYLGIYELAPELERSIVSKNELQLMTAVEQRLALPFSSKQQSTWVFLKKAISDSYYVDSKFSPRVVTPLVVYRGIRNLSKDISTH